MMMMMMSESDVYVLFLAAYISHTSCTLCILPPTISNEQDKQQDTNHTCHCSERVEPW